MNAAALPVLIAICWIALWVGVLYAIGLRIEVAHV